MPEIHTEVEIDAPAQHLWEVLADFQRYPEWNPFLIRLDGAPKVGSPLGVKVKSGVFTVSFRTQVLVLDADRELRWAGHFLHARVVEAQHYFQIESLGPTRSRFIHGERFTGFLARVAFAVIARHSPRGFAVMNQAFKERVEAMPASSQAKAS